MAKVTPDITMHGWTVCHGGWDDAIRMSCGESHGAVLILYGRNDHRIEEQFLEQATILRRREADRLAKIAAEKVHAEAVENSMARFYV